MDASQRDERQRHSVSAPLFSASRNQTRSLLDPLRKKEVG